MVDLAQTIEEWKDIQSVKVDDQVNKFLKRKISSLILEVPSPSNYDYVEFIFRQGQNL
jgi:hypothetical protein